jgi:hypothetical protein
MIFFLLLVVLPAVSCSIGGPSADNPSAGGPSAGGLPAGGLSAAGGHSCWWSFCC